MAISNDATLVKGQTAQYTRKRTNRIQPPRQRTERATPFFRIPIIKQPIRSESPLPPKYQLEDLAAGFRLLWMVTLLVPLCLLYFSSLRDPGSVFFLLASELASNAGEEGKKGRHMDFQTRKRHKVTVSRSMTFVNVTLGVHVYIKESLF